MEKLRTILKNAKKSYNKLSDFNRGYQKACDDTLEQIKERKCVMCGGSLAYYEPFYCNKECAANAFWLDIAIEALAHERIIINGNSYVLGTLSHTKGFDGKTFVIEFDDGRKITTDNLWHNGEIPEKWKRLIKDNAKFIKGETYEKETETIRL